MDEKLCEQLNLYCKTYSSGCYKKCPCPLYTNCSYYTDETGKIKRIKKKSTLSKFNKDTEEWYKVNFRNEIKMEDSIMNG